MLKVVFEPINNISINSDVINNTNNILKKKIIYEEEPITGVKAEKKEKILKEYSLSNQINNLTKLVLINSKLLIELKEYSSNMGIMDDMDQSIFENLRDQYNIVEKQLKTINSIIEDNI